MHGVIKPTWSKLAIRFALFTACAVIAAVAVLATSTPATADAPHGYDEETHRNYLDQPFNSFSFWNLALHVDAWDNGYYKPANMTPTTWRSSSVTENLLLLDPTAPERQVWRTPFSSAWHIDRGLSGDANRVINRCETAQTLMPGPKALVPEGFSTIDEFTGIGPVPDFPSAILNPAAAFEGLSVRETQPLEVCPDGKVVSTVDYAHEFPVDARGDGRCGLDSGGGGTRTATCPTGAHGGTGLPSIGGVIRRGEFSSGEIRHALKLSLPVGDLYRRNDEINPTGFVWPAHSIDNYADVGGIGRCGNPWGRSGTNPFLYTGSHLALSPHFDLDVLQSEPGRIIARALMDFGAYNVDSLGPPCTYEPDGISERTIHVEVGPGRNLGQPDVTAEFEALYGYGMTTFVNGAQTPYSQDLDVIWSELHVVWHPCKEDGDPNGGTCAEFIGGGPTCAPAAERRAPIAPEGWAIPACGEAPIPRMVINEIHYNPADLDGGAGPEFIELVNPGGVTVDLSGFNLDDRLTLPDATTVAAGQFLVVTSDLSAFNQRYPGVPALEWTASLRLDDAGETVHLWTPDGRIVDSVTYGNG